MNISLKVICLSGLGLSLILWIFFCLVELLHAESCALSFSALSITIVIFIAVVLGSTFLDAVGALLSLLPLAFLLFGTWLGRGESSQAPIWIPIIFWSWALFYGLVAFWLASRIPNLKALLSGKRNR